MADHVISGSGQGSTSVGGLSWEDIDLAKWFYNSDGLIIREI